MSRTRTPRRPTVLLLPILLAALGVGLLPVRGAAAAATAGWSRLDLSDGGYAWLFVPKTVSGQPPAMVFLHGAGGTPEPYRPWIGKAAERFGVVAVLPRAVSNQGWGLPGDGQRVAAAIDAAAAAVAIDARRTGIAGHSAGGAYAYLLAYAAGMPVHAIFTLAAPFYPVAAPAAGAPPPIRMYYGSEDPNYTGGSYQRLVDQWQALGVPWEADLRQGYGHGSWPQESMDQGVAFLAGAAPLPGAGACVPGPTVLCLRDGRYRVEVAWEDPRGDRGAGRVVPTGSDASGLFWFFAPGNWELMVKVLDGCPVNGHRWVFSAATTNVAYALTVDDTQSGDTWRFENPSGRPAPAVTDTTALPCP
jgi:dienelactone hydrolase